MADPPAPDRPTRASLRPAPIHAVTAPLARFLRVEAASGVALLACAVVAVVLANTSAADAVHRFWDTHLRIGLGGWALDEPLHFWVNDALMAVFFFVVGLEIKREVAGGELSTVRKAALPVIAAAGGMLVPAGVYLAFGHDPAAARGWGVPMATDIAFVVGVMALFGRRVPAGLKVFLLSLAIADDLGAVAVIAAVYTDHLNWLMLATAAGGLGLVVLLQRLGVRAVAVYVLVGIGVWLAVLKSGVHPTIAGVALGLLTPARAWLSPAVLRLALDDVAGRMNEPRADGDDLGLADVALLRYAAREAVAPLPRLLDRLHPWVGFAVMPLFALANAGVEVKPAAMAHPVAVAVAVGLVAGKAVGIGLFGYLAVRLKLAELPAGVAWPMLFAAGVLGGIGFTMSLFVAGLAFPGRAELLAGAKVGVLVGSAAAGALGAAALGWSVRTSGRAGGNETPTLSPGAAERAPSEGEGGRGAAG